MGEVANTSVASTLLLLSAFSSCLLGGIVLFRNPRRRTHQMFAVLTFNIALWAVGVFFIIRCDTQASARFWIMATFVAASFLPAAYYQFVGFFPHQRFEGNRYLLWVLYAGAAAVALGVGTPYYIVRIEVFPDAPPLVQYGPVFAVYAVLLLTSTIASVTNLMRKLRNAEGIKRRQIEHTLVSMLTAASCALVTNIFAPFLDIGTMELYGPCFMVIMMAGLAYTMVRYQLLDIWFIVTRTTVYAVITAFIVLTFMGTVSVVHYVFSGGGRAADLLTTGLSALIVVLLLQPIKERVQLLLDRLIIYRRYDSDALIERISRYATDIARHDQMFQRVARDLQQTMGINTIRVLLVNEKEAGVVATAYSSAGGDDPNEGLDHEFLLGYMARHPGPIVLEEILHQRVNPERAHLATHLAEMEAYLLAPLKTSAGLVGMITAGQKNSRDIYTREDVQLFSTISAPLATAIENARLYRKLEELNLHMERIMGSMRGGVIAVDKAGRITTINQEAHSLFGGVTAGQTLDVLDPAIAEILRITLKEGRGIRDVEMTVRSASGEAVPVAVSSSCIAPTARENLGAMVLIFNMTDIKRLQSNVHRADRLTSIGTMAAGMAHEIKNPLQSIKTFSQLLLDRFDDADFRKTFSEVVPPEVQRIDTIVTRLLDFARPQPVRFAPQNLQEIVEDVLALVENQIRKERIRVQCEFPEENRQITGDDQQLHQVFLNLLLNAIDAMKQSAERTLRIRIYYDRAHLRTGGQTTLLDVPCAVVLIRDTGCGIPKQHQKQLFTPFFTTKTHGSGLGLSVVHGIVKEHGGDIDVQSEAGQGATFSLTFPLVGRAETAERIEA